MNLLVTLQKGGVRQIHFPDSVMEALKQLGNVKLNEMDRGFTQDELKENIKGIDFCITHWGCPKITEDVLQNADRLKMVAHAAGSVAYMITDCVYEKGIKVCSSNDIMAEYVAEGVLAYILSALRSIPKHAGDLKNGVLWGNDLAGSRSLIGEKVGLVGLGTVGRYLLELLKPFHVKIKLYDPYINPDLLKGHQNVELSTLEDAMAWGNIVSIHASLTPDTYHMIDAGKLKLLKDGTLFVNTARGAVIDEKALEDVLETGRISAVLDVFEKEPLPLDSRLRGLENVILMPHMAGAGAKEKMTFAMIDEIKRYINGEPLKYEIPFEKYKLMTRE